MFATGKNKILKKYSLRQTVKEVMFDIDLTSGDDSQDSQEDKVIYENALRKCLPSSATITQPREIDHSGIDLSIPNDSLLASLGYRSPRSSPNKCIKPLTCYSPSIASSSIQTLTYVSPSKHSRKRSLRSSNQPLQSSISSFNRDFFPFQHNLPSLPSPNVSSINSPSSLSKYALSLSPRSSKSLTPASPLSSTASQNATITSRTKPRVSFANASPVSSSSVRSFTPPSSEDSNSDLDSESDSEYFSSSSSFNFSSQNCKSKSKCKPKKRNESLRSLRTRCQNSSSKPLTQESNESENPRRSSRTRVKPLEFWRGEVPIYKPQADGTFVLDGIAEASASSQATNKRRKSSSSSDSTKTTRKRAHSAVALKKPLVEKKDSKRSYSTRSASKTPTIETSKRPSPPRSRRSSLKTKVTEIKDEDSKQEQAKTSTSSSESRKAESESKSTKLSQDVSSQTSDSNERKHVETNTQTENMETLNKKCVKVATEAAPKVTLVDKSTNSDIIPDESSSEASDILRLKNKLDWQVSQTSKDVFLASAEGTKDSGRRRGYLKILGKGEKPSQITGSYDMDLMIIEGKVSVTIGDADAVVFSCPYTFSIPSHTCYSIKNLLDSDAFFSFYIFCET